MTLQEKVQRLRKSRGWSQEELAARLDVSRQALSKWELGTAVPDTANVIKLCRLFDVSADVLLDDAAALDEQSAASRKMLTSRWPVSTRALRLLEEKGYMGAYYLAAVHGIWLLLAAGIVAAYLRVLAQLAPLTDFPPQAFLMPAIAAVLGLVVLAVRSIWKDKKAGKSCGGCSGCAGCGGSCHKEQTWERR